MPKFWGLVSVVRVAWSWVVAWFSSSAMRTFWLPVYLLELLADGGGVPVSIEPLRNPERFNDVVIITLREDAA
jgi:hypothetical protein